LSAFRSAQRTQRKRTETASIVAFKLAVIEKSVIGRFGQYRKQQQQGGHIEHLMQKLQDVTVSLDNN